MASFKSFLDRWLLAHPRGMGEGYAEHGMIAAGFALGMISGGVRCLIHAAIPGLFETAASDRIDELHRELDRRRRATAVFVPDYVI